MGSILLQHSIGCVARRLAAQTETRADSPACDCGVDKAFRYIAELEAERDAALDAEDALNELNRRLSAEKDALRAEVARLRVFVQRFVDASDREDEGRHDALLALAHDARATLAETEEGVEKRD